MASLEHAVLPADCAIRLTSHNPRQAEGSGLAESQKPRPAKLPRSVGECLNPIENLSRQLSKTRAVILRLTAFQG